MNHLNRKSPDGHAVGWLEQKSTNGFLTELKFAAWSQYE